MWSPGAVLSPSVQQPLHLVLQRTLSSPRRTRPRPCPGRGERQLGRLALETDSGELNQHFSTVVIWNTLNHTSSVFGHVQHIWIQQFSLVLWELSNRKNIKEQDLADGDHFKIHNTATLSKMLPAGTSVLTLQSHEITRDFSHKLPFLYPSRINSTWWNRGRKTPTPTAPLGPLAWIKFVLSNFDKKCALCRYLFCSCGRVCLLIHTM